MGIIKNLRSRIADQSCYTFRSKSGNALLSVCGNLGAARITTPQTTILVDAAHSEFKDELIPAFAEAYRHATDAGDNVTAKEIHDLRRAICN